MCIKCFYCIIENRKTDRASDANLINHKLEASFIIAKFVNHLVDKTSPIFIDEFLVNTQHAYNALSLSEDIVDRSQVFTRRKVENDHSTVHVVAGKVNSILKA